MIMVKIHRSSVFHPSSDCAVLRNTTWSTDPSIQSCIWECAHEDHCQTAAYFDDVKICSLFTESCKPNAIESSQNIQASVICYRNNPGKSLFLLEY